MTTPSTRAQHHYPVDAVNIEGQLFQNISSSLAPICLLFRLIVEIVLYINSEIARLNIRERMIENLIGRTPHPSFGIVKINDGAWKAFTI